MIITIYQCLIDAHCLVYLDNQRSYRFGRLALVALALQKLGGCKAKCIFPTPSHNYAVFWVQNLEFLKSQLLQKYFASLFLYKKKGGRVTLQDLAIVQSLNSTLNNYCTAS